MKASLRAAEQSQRRVRILAVEKNPNALVTLQRMHHALGWKDKVTIVASDMRDFRPDEKADILVSELLGSFGDNALSPECLVSNCCAWNAHMAAASYMLRCTPLLSSTYVGCCRMEHRHI